MNHIASLLQELEESIQCGSDESRLRALWHATDVLTAGQYSEKDIWVFGEVIELLARELEVAARAELARRLANSKNAPVNCISQLACDNSIDVAGPILRQSERLDVRTLISIARSGRQQHLHAISNRKSVSEPVTDVLVVTGIGQVVESLVKNANARFSHFGFMELIKRSEQDSVLVETLGKRADMPRHIFQQLISKASDEVRERLERERPDAASKVRTTVADATGELHSIFGPASMNYFLAKQAVSTLHRQGRLHENNIFEYAQSRKFSEVTIGLSLLCSLPANVVERGLIDTTGEMPIIFARALGFTWEKTMSLLFLGAASRKFSVRDLDALELKFYRLTDEAAQSVIRLYQSSKGSAPGELNRT